jgi:tRNA pseudouridine38-40 synthase
VTAGRVFRLTVAYDGTDFHGWQKQPGLRTVQGELERAAAEALGVEGIRVHGAGRTDQGVHARGQVGSLVAETAWPASGVRAHIQRGLPRDVRVTDAAEEAPGFHARHSARARRYAFRLLDREDVLYGRFAWWPGHEVDGDRLALTAAPLVGDHDCSAFGAQGSSDASPLCRIGLSRWTRWEAGWMFEVQADHFLYHMVRNLVGTALQAARTSDPAGRMSEVLASRDRARGGPTVSPRGLCLEDVSYREGGWIP